jgi:hypothetical protein
MNRVFLFFLITGALSVPLRAECEYFRVSTKLLKCGTVDAKSVQESSFPYQDNQDLPDLAATESQTMVQATCECQYSLKGSDIRCDLDQTMERSSVLGNDDSANPCLRGRSLCKDVCPSDLP